jgi:hypothetical protein
LTAEFDRLARLRTLGTRQQDNTQQHIPQQNHKPPMVA